ncbi:hypothetical protein R9X48_02475 [Lacticaseibacillus rhamnosus]
MKAKWKKGQKLRNIKDFEALVGRNLFGDRKGAGKKIYRVLTATRVNFCRKSKWVVLKQMSKTDFLIKQ